MHKLAMQGFHDYDVILSHLATSTCFLKQAITREGRGMTRTPPWLVPAVFALILWGAWGVLQKNATNQMEPRNVYFISSLGALAAVLFILSTSRFPLSLNFEGAFFALVAGVCSSLGGLLFLEAMKRGEAAIVITFTALYPAVSIALSFLLLNEAITMKQGIGIVLALISMLLMK